MLNIRDLCFSFDKKNIFTNLNLSFETGEVTGIVGKNGVGKTTLFRIMSQIYSMQGGSIELDGKSLKSFQVAFMPTEPYFYPLMKGKEYLSIVSSDRKEKAESESYAAMLDLPLEELIDNYSTGMRKKLAFSALFALEKPVIILDEPYNGVDLESNEMMKHIIKTNHKNRIVLFSSHILSTITDVSHSIYHLEEETKINHYFPNQFPDLKQVLIEKIEAKNLK